MLRQPPSFITELLLCPDHPDEQQALNDASDRPLRMNKQKSRGFPPLNKLPEVTRHCTHITRNQHTAILGCHPKNFRIRGAVWDHASSGTEINRRLPAPKASADCGIQIGVCLKPKAQGCLSDNSRLARSKRSTISGGNGLRALNSSHLPSCSFKYESNPSGSQPGME